LRHHHDGWGARLVVFRQKRASERGAQAEDPEVVAGHDFAEGQARPVTARQHCERRAVSDQVVEDRARRLQVQVVGIGTAGISVAVGRVGVDVHEAVGFANRKRPEQYRVDEAEQRRVEADAERERRHGNQGKAGTAAQPPGGEAKVVPHGLGSLGVLGLK
jgi:hypothetical protein